MKTFEEINEYLNGIMRDRDNLNRIIGESVVNLGKMDDILDDIVESRKLALQADILQWVLEDH